MKNTEMSKLNPMNLYKIGTGWIFNIEDNTGYLVEREESLLCKRKGRILGFSYAFRLTQRADNGYQNDCKIAIPAGVLRKAKEILELHKEGKLEARKTGYK